MSGAVEASGGSAGALTRAYEALRAQATGQVPTTAPRGLALFLTHGTPAWVAAWAPLAPLAPIPVAVPGAGAADALVQVLTAMALGRQRQRTA